MSHKNQNLGLLQSVKNENYINILKNENTELDNKLKKVNELVSKLKTQITENEQEKNLLITSSYQKDKDLESIKKQLKQTKYQVNEIKNQNQNKLSLLVNQNNILQKNKELNSNTIAELQQKIAELELKLKSSSIINKKFSILSSGHNFSFGIQGIQKKSSNEGLPEILNIKNTEMKNNNDIFLTGRNELIEMKENNQKLQEQLEALQNELNKHETDKINMMKELEQYNKEKNSLLNSLNEKNEQINGKLNKENELNNNLMKQLIENKKIKNNLDNIKIKCQNLEKNKKELEDVIFQQENKVNELSSSVQKIVNIVKIKNIELNNNKIYINNLEETIKDLNKEFHQMRLKKKKENTQEITNLKNQLENLKKEYQKLIAYNNNIGLNRQLFNYNHISNNHIISRNYNINNYNNNGNKKIKIKMCLNNNPNSGLSYSALNISNILNIKEHKGKRVKSQKIIHKNEFNYDLNYDMNQKNFNSSNKNNFFRKNNETNLYQLNNLNMNNIRIKKTGIIRYNSNFNSIKQQNKVNNKSFGSNSSLQILKGYKFNNDLVGVNSKKRKIKKIRSIALRHKLVDNKKLESIFDGSNDNNNIINKTSDLLKKKKGIAEKERIEKQKIEEFKNLLDQIMNDIEN